MSRSDGTGAGPATSTGQISSRQFLVLYDYGQGGVWAIVTAISHKDVAAKMPMVEIMDEGPSWHDWARVSRIPEALKFSVDNLPAWWK